MVLFLDFDGVLHPTDRRDGPFSCLPQFEQVVRSLPSFDIVISSSWRADHSFCELRAVFSTDIALRVIGTTPYMTDGFSSQMYGRESEIRKWLNDAGRADEPWIALDDCEWMFSPACSELIHVDSKTGFSKIEENALRLRIHQLI